MMTEVRNACSAIAVGSKSASAKSDDDLEKAERKAFGGCSQYSNDCKILILWLFPPPRLLNKFSDGLLSSEAV